MWLLLGCMALFAPRLVIILVVIFSDYIGQAYQTTIWPLLGFLFMPVTTLAYAFIWHQNGGTISGGWIVLLIVAVMIDLGMFGGAEKARRRHSK